MYSDEIREHKHIIDDFSLAKLKIQYSFLDDSLALIVPEGSLHCFALEQVGDVGFFAFDPRLVYASGRALFAIVGQTVGLQCQGIRLVKFVGILAGEQSDSVALVDLASGVFSNVVDSG